jgi:hypothetical protein
MEERGGKETCPAWNKYNEVKRGLKNGEKYGRTVEEREREED